MLATIKTCNCGGEAFLFCINGRYYVCCGECGLSTDHSELSLGEAINSWNNSIKDGGVDDKC